MSSLASSKKVSVSPAEVDFPPLHHDLTYIRLQLQHFEGKHSVNFQSGHPDSSLKLVISRENV